jgi:AcrR family transcriptional regulator
VDYKNHSSVGKRRYHSRIRQRQAKETHQRLLAVARELLASKGYANVTLEMIAEAAEVSPKTISAVFGSKRGLLTALINPATFGDPFQQLLTQIRSTPEPALRVSLVAKLTRQAYEPFVPEFELLRTASAVAPELADLARQIETRRRQNQGRLIAYLDERHMLRQDLSPEEAADVLWTLTGYDLYRLLVVERRWPPERYETWLAQLLIHHLLRPGEG